GCTASPCAGADKDATAGVFCLQGVLGGATYTIHESVVPTGYIGPADQTLNKAGALTTNTNCPVTPPDKTFINTLQTLTINKIDAFSSKPLTGATFTVSPNPFACHQPAATFPATIKDGDALDASGSATDGIIKITRVCSGTYTVTARAPPRGYWRDPATEQPRGHDATVGRGG